MKIPTFFKSLMTAIIFLLIPWEGKATGLSGDFIYLQGEEWELLAKPINRDSVLFHRLMEFLPDNHCITTANWEGYTAYWEVQQSHLYLHHLEVCVYDKQKKEEYSLTYQPDQLKEVFQPYYQDEKIGARWFSGELRAGKGELVRYVHSDFDRNLETEQVMMLQHGRIKSCRTYHNTLRAGMKMQHAQDEIIRRFPWHRFPEYKGQRITFFVENVQCSSDGHLVDVRTIFVRPQRENIEDGNHPLAKAFEEVLKSIYPWEVLFINGKYTIEFKDFVLSIWKDKLKPSQTNDTTKYTLVGKVYGEEVRQIPPYDVVKFPAGGAYLTLAGKPFQGWLADSTGTFSIEHLEKGEYRLKVQFIGLTSCDTLIHVPMKDDTLQLRLSLPYDYIEKYDCSPALSREYIEQGKPNLRLIIPIGKEEIIRKYPFWKKYGVTYFSYAPLKKDGKLDCYLGTPNHLLTAYNEEVFRYLDKKFGQKWRKEVPPGIFGLDQSLNELHDYNWLIKTLSRECKYPVAQQKRNKGCVLQVEYTVTPEGYISHATVLNQVPRAFRKSVMQVFQSLRNVPTVLRPGKSTLSIQFWLDNMAKGPHADILIIGYSSCDTPVLMRYDAVLTAHTTEPHLEVGVPVCYLNERGDTIVPYGKYRYCQTDTITEIGFVYENKPKKSRIVCINDAGKELFYVFKCDNGPDYLKEGLFRMMDEQGRIGFADSSGNVVIHPQFLYATPFANGHAYVTEHGGESNEREHTSWQSDEWKIINRNGNKLLEYTVIQEDKAVKELLIRYSHPSGSIRSLTYTYPEDIVLADNFHAEVTLKDLNFDGQDDIAIPLGNYGNQRIQYEDGYLWDKTQKTYVPVKQLKEIANLRIDKEERCLFSFSRESAASYHYERYEYVDAELVKTAELIQTYRQAGGKPLFTEKHYQKGKGMRVAHSSVPIHEISHYWLKIVQK